VDTLLDAYAMAKIEHEKWPLTLMGDGPLRPLIEYAIDRRQVSNARVLGFVDEETKRQEIQNARWMVVPPNTREDFGLTAVEARHLGVPCIITRDGGLPEAGGRQALICEPDDPAALARLLEQAAAMEETEYGRAGGTDTGGAEDGAGADRVLRERVPQNRARRGSEVGSFPAIANGLSGRIYPRDLPRPPLVSLWLRSERH